MPEGSMSRRKGGLLHPPPSVLEALPNHSNVSILHISAL